MSDDGGSGSSRKYAFVSTLLTLTGVIVGSGATYLATFLQVSADTEQFLRSQKLTAYSQFMADSQELDRALDSAAALATGNKDRVGKDEIATIKKPIDDTYEKLNNDVSVINLIGSSDSLKSANILFEADSARYRQIWSVELDISLDVDELRYRSEVNLLRGTTVDDKRQGMLDEFSLAARKDSRVGRIRKTRIF